MQIYKSNETGNYYTQKELANDFEQFKADDPESYGDMSFGEYLLDCLGKNGSLYKVDTSASEAFRIADDLAESEFCRDIYEAVKFDGNDFEAVKTNLARALYNTSSEGWDVVDTLFSWNDFGEGCTAMDCFLIDRVCTYFDARVYELAHTA